MTAHGVPEMLSRFVEIETRFPQKQRFITTCLVTFVDAPRLEELVIEMDEIFCLIDICSKIYTMNELRKTRTNGIFADRKAVLAWASDVADHMSVARKKEAIERLFTTVTLGRLAHLQKTDDVKTMRDLLRVSDRAAGADDARLDYDFISHRLRECVCSASWYFTEYASCNATFITTILLEQCSLSVLARISDEQLREIVLFTIATFIQAKPPNFDDIGEELIALAEGLTSDGEDQQKITGMVLNFFYEADNKKSLVLFLYDREVGVRLLQQALAMLNNAR